MTPEEEDRRVRDAMEHVAREIRKALPPVAEEARAARSREATEALVLATLRRMTDGDDPLRHLSVRVRMTGPVSFGVAIEAKTELGRLVVQDMRERAAGNGGGFTEVFDAPPGGGRGAG